MHNHVGLFDQCILIFSLNEVGSYCAFLGQRYKKDLANMKIDCQVGRIGKG